MAQILLTEKQIQEAKAGAGFIKAVLESIKYRTPVIGPMAFSIGEVEERMIKFAKKNGIKLSSDSLFMTYHRIAHAKRTSKRQGQIDVSDNDLINFPLRRFYLDLYYDTHNKGFIYVDGYNKYIISPSYKIKTVEGKEMKVAFVTATYLTKGEMFNHKRYIKIESSN